MTSTPPTLERSTLFVPASRPDVIAKAAQSEADAVCIDLEDSVAPDHKESSRAHVVHALRELHFGRRIRIVRINGLDTPFAYRDVIDVVEAAGDALEFIMLPKTRGAADIQFVDLLLTQIEARLGIARRIGIEAQIETALGFVNLREIAASSTRLQALIFGMGDYAASMHMPLASIGEADGYDTAYRGDRWHAVKHGIVATARASGLRCMDGPMANYTDTMALARACGTARGLGFDGKQCIHPSQLATVNSTFSPSPAEVTWAEGIVTAYEAALAGGRGAIGTNGVMIDAANVRLAQSTLHLHQAVSALKKESLS